MESPTKQQSRNPQTQPLVNLIPQPTPNPLQDWAMLAKLGSYGQMGVSNQSHVNVTPQPQQNNDEGEQQTSHAILDSWFAHFLRS